MKKSFLIVLLSCISMWASAQSNFENAQKTAKDEHKFILLNFSGSDWCIPCIKLRKEIFDNATFKSMSDSLLIMIDADFPRNKKNQLDKNTIKQNEILADKYNANGAFPFTVLIDYNGKILKTWDGFPKGDAASFAEEIRILCHTDK